MPEVITSPSNPKVKRLLALQQKSSARREAGLFVVEGRRELQHCIDAGFEIDSVFYCPSFLASGSGELPLKTSGDAGPLPLPSEAGPSLLRSRLEEEVSPNRGLQGFENKPACWLRFSEAAAFRTTNPN